MKKRSYHLCQVITPFFALIQEKLSNKSFSMVDAERCFKKFSVQPGNVSDCDTLGANILTFTLIAAVSEAVLIHLHNHGNGTFFRFQLSLW